MKHAQELFQNEITDLRRAFDQAQETPRKYTQKLERHYYKPEHARFKMVVWFKDGNKRYFYSYDNKHYTYQDSGKKITKVLIDEYEGLKKLLRLVYKYKDKFKNIRIYSNIDINKQTVDGNYNYEILKVDIYNNIKAHPVGNFLNEKKNVIFDVQRMKNVGQLRIDEKKRFNQGHSRMRV